MTRQLIFESVQVIKVDDSKMCSYKFSPGGKVKLYRVKSEAPAQQLTSGNSKYKSIMFYEQCFNTTDTFNHCSATDVQAVSSSVQRPVTLSTSSSSASSIELPVSHEAREQIHIQQVFGSDSKPLGEYLFSAF